MSKQTVIEQDNRFHLVISASIGFRLSDGSVLLEMDAMGESIAAMGSNPMPDFGMPKPKAEYLVSGSFHAPGGEPVTGGEVKVEFAGLQKTLYVFGDRIWQLGVPSAPEMITEMPLDYSHAFGGKGYAKNPVGIGFEQEALPNLENPDQLLTSARSSMLPAGLGVLDPMTEQRTRFQGTYDDTYLQKYYPGYPADFDWHYFMCSAEDQWSHDYYQGNETFALQHMHPDKPLITGQLPGYVTRSFAKLTDKSELQELYLNLDTVWFFPESDLGLLIWRGGMDVEDDEADEIEHIMLAYEQNKAPRRDKTHYEALFAHLSNSKGPLIAQFSAQGLIPDDEKCAMQLLQDKSLENTEESEFSKNLNAKSESTAAMTIAKVEEAMAEMKAGMPEDAPGKSKELLDLENILKNPPSPEKDVDIVKLHETLEKILPGITAGDPAKLKLIDFSFDKIDSIMQEMEKFQQKKKDYAMEQVKTAQQELRSNIDKQVQEMGSEDKEAIKEMQKTLSQLEELEKPQLSLSPVPRIDANTIMDGLDQLEPQTMEAMQNLQNMKSMGVDDETTRQLEELIHQSTVDQDQEMRQRMQDIELEFKSLYRETAHFQPDGLPPHHDMLKEKRVEFKQAIEAGKSVNKMDWSGLDLSGLQLDGIDLSDCYLEQVDLSKSSLRNANLNGAILARAKLDDADFTGSNLQNANIGAVSAKGANFTDCLLDSARMSKGNFSWAKFNNAQMEGVEILDIIIDHTNFSEAVLNGFQFINIEMKEVNFSGAQLDSSCFMQCKFDQCDFSKSSLKSTTWADSSLKKIKFDWANMTSACFASTDAELSKLEEVSFAACCLDKANFQGIDMQRSNLSNASIIQANFSSANLYAANLSGTVAHKTLFRKAILTNTNMEKIDLREGSLGKAHLTGATVTGANLFAVDLLRATVGDTLFNDSILDNTIIQDWRP